MMQLIPMALVGLAAVLIPRLRPQLYRAAATTRTVAGVPVLAIAGAASLISAAVLYYLYFDEEYFGLGDPGTFFALARLTSLRAEPRPLEPVRVGQRARSI